MVEGKDHKKVKGKDSMVNYIIVSIILAICLIMLIVIIVELAAGKKSKNAGFNIFFNYTANTVLTIPPPINENLINEANDKKIYNFNLNTVNSQSGISEIATILFDNPQAPKYPSTYNVYMDQFVNGKNRLMVTIPYTSTLPTFKSSTVPQLDSLIQFSTWWQGHSQTATYENILCSNESINRIQVPLIPDSVYASNIDYAYNGNIILAIYIYAYNSSLKHGNKDKLNPTQIMGIQDAINGLVGARITPAINLIKNANEKRKANGFKEKIALVLPFEPQFVNQYTKKNSQLDDNTNVYMFTLNDPTKVSLGVPTDSRIEGAFQWWTYQLTQNKSLSNTTEYIYQNLLVGAQSANINIYLSQSMFPILWEYWNKTCGVLSKEDRPSPSELEQIVLDRIKVMEAQLPRHPNINLLISSFGWPSTCGVCSQCSTASLGLVDPQSVSPKQAQKNQCRFWELFLNKISRKIPRYYWVLNNDSQRQLCANSIDDFMSNAAGGNANGWRITDMNTGKMKC